MVINRQFPFLLAKVRCSGASQKWGAVYRVEEETTGAGFCCYYCWQEPLSFCPGFHPMVVTTDVRLRDGREALGGGSGAAELKGIP